MGRLIGIVGGTFDPIHYGHLLPVDRLSDELSLPEVRYVLSARPPHRTAPLAPAEDRYRMLELALAGYPRFLADDQEMRRPGPSFTLWTVRKLRQQYADDALCLIVGMDAYLGMHSWHRWQEIMALTHIIVLARPGWSQNGEGNGGDERMLRSRQSGVVMFAQSLELTLNATDIRNSLSRGQDVSDALPAAVVEYIRRHRLYNVKINE